MKADLKALLEADAGVAAACGGRISWGERPQGGALPAVVLQVIGGRDEYHLRGRLGRVERRVQADCWAADPLAASTLADAVRDCLGGYRGTVGATRFTGVFLDGDRDLSEAAGAAEPRLHRVALDFMVNTTSTGA